MPFQGTFSEFLNAGLAVAWTEIRTQEGIELLIGDVNRNGGACDCCLQFGARDRAWIVGYRVWFQS